MTLTVYPAKLVIDGEGRNCWESEVPMQGDSERLRKGTDEELRAMDNPFEPNPEYFPFSSMDISSGNLYAVMRNMRIKDVDDCFDNGRADIKEVFRKAHAALYMGGRVRDMEEYVSYRTFSLMEMARLGISRGATHIVWA
jgi:hypothetical protein